MPDLTDRVRQEIADRLKELRPLVAEYERLQRAAQALDIPTATATAAATDGRRRASGPRATSTRGRRTAGASNGAPRGRRRGSGQRSAQALKLVTKRPGITIPELAERMGIKQNYLYRVLPALEADGKVRKEGRGWHPTAA